MCKFRTVQARKHLPEHNNLAPIRPNRVMRYTDAV